MLDTEGFRVHLHLTTGNRNSVCNQVTMRVQRKRKAFIGRHPDAWSVDSK